VNHDVALVLMGVAAGVLASLATGLAVRVAIGGRAIVVPQAAAAGDADYARDASGAEQEIAIALAAVAGFAKSR
jgi:hypothetical protein